MLKAMLRKREEGFTLVELMIVVAIIGVLAALAIYGVSRYLKHSKTAEATRNLGSIETGSKNQFQQETDQSGTGVGPFVHRFCPDSQSGGVPTAGVPKAAKVKAPAAEWDHDSWKCLKFSINEPQFYLYKYVGNTAQTGTDASYTATANGDLDGNGVVSTFQLVGKGSMTGDAQRMSMQAINEDE